MRLKDRIPTSISALNAHLKRLKKRMPLTPHRRRLKRIDARLDDLDGSWRQHLPALLNAVSTVGALGHELVQQRQAFDQQRQAFDQQLDQHGSSIRELWDRLEFIRRELFYEVNFGAGNAPNASEAKPARIVNPEKLAEARRDQSLRVNIGCGHIALDGYINVDMRDLPGVDVVTDVGHLPFEPESVDELYSAHVLEHFPEEQLRRALLPHWYSLLAPGGTLRAVVPDGEAMLAHFAAGDYDFEDFREVLFGAQEYHGDFHFNMFTPASLTKLLAEGGFRNVEIPVKGRRNGKCFEFEIKAERPSAVET